MNHQAKVLSTEILERVDDPSSRGWNNGHETLKVEIYYRKEGRPRGYYLHITTYRDLDNGATQHDIFGHPTKWMLLAETKAFSAKTLAAITVDPVQVASAVAEVKAKHTEYRAKQKAERAALATV